MYKVRFHKQLLCTCKCLNSFHDTVFTNVHFVYVYVYIKHILFQVIIYCKCLKYVNWNTHIYFTSKNSFRYLSSTGTKTGTEQSSFEFLRRELPLRLANIMMKMNQLPDVLLKVPSVKWSATGMFTLLPRFIMYTYLYTCTYSKIQIVVVQCTKKVEKSSHISPMTLNCTYKCVYSALLTRSYIKWWSVDWDPYLPRSRSYN